MSSRCVWGKRVKGSPQYIWGALTPSMEARPKWKRAEKTLVENGRAVVENGRR